MTDRPTYDLPVALGDASDMGDTPTFQGSLMRAAAARIRELEAAGDALADFARGHELDGPPLDAWENR